MHTRAYGHTHTCTHLSRYLLFAADPYEVIAFKVPNVEVDKTEGRLFTHCECDILGRACKL